MTQQRMLMMATVVAASTLVLLLSCNQDGSANQGDGAGDACVADADCADGFVCSNGVCSEVPLLDCTSNGDCPDGYVCTNGYCMDPNVVQDCTSNGDCGEGQVCEAGYCLMYSELADCSSNGDCTGGLVCEAGECVVAAVSCTTNGECGAGQVCESGLCVEALPTLNLRLMEATTRVPYVVRFDMRIKDANSNAITEGITGDDFRIYENGRLADYRETNQFVTPGANLPLKVVLVLDYTNSMSAASAIESMISAAEDFVDADHFTATHYLGIVEFHDRGPAGEGFSTAVELTQADPEDSSGKAAIINGIPKSDELEHGLSRVWDAVDLALNMLAETERQDGEFQAIVFLTDGRDTTSDADAESLTARAVSEDIVLYPIGFSPDATDESALSDMAVQTSGQYSAADNADDLAGVFVDIVEDLRGQWNLTYITQRNSGAVNVMAQFDWGGETASFEYDFDAGQLGGDIHEGTIEVADRWLTTDGTGTSFLLRATYVPRNIDRFRFQFAPSDTSFSLQGVGGLTSSEDGWTVSTIDDGIFEIVGEKALEYGAFGNIGVVTVPEIVDTLQVSHDDTVYDSLVQPKTMVFEGDLYGAPRTLSLLMDPEDGGTVIAYPDKPYYSDGEIVSLTVIASGDNVFNEWTGDASGSDTSVSVAMDEDREVTAVFYPPRTLTVLIDPVDAGTVGLIPPDDTYKHNEVVTLIALPEGNHVFNSWSGSATGTTDTLTITMDGDKTVTATFYAERTLNITVSPDGAGAVTVVPDQDTYAQGDVVTLTAVPNGTTFTGWSGGISSTANPVVVTIQSDLNITATFE